jgi:hypothetical protein
MLKTIFCGRLGVEIRSFWRRWAFAGVGLRFRSNGGTEHDIASRYAGCAWGDSTEHQLNDAVATWSHASSLAT